MDMALPVGQPNAHLIERLARTPQHFEFFQAVRLAHEVLRQAAQDAGLPLPPANGVLELNAAAAVTFHSTVGLGFPGGAIVRSRFLTASVNDAGEPIAPVLRRIAFETAISCLLGPTGVLPSHYSAMVLDRWRTHRDLTFLHFCDIFTHRNTTLLYSAWTKYRPAIQQEQVALRGTRTAWDQGAAVPRSPITAVVANLVGLGTPGLGNRLSIDDAVVFRYAGHFTSFPRSAAALELMLSDFCQAPVAVEQFVGQWLRLEPADQTRLATRAGTAGCNAQLGIDTIAGARVWDLESKFVIHLGPVGLDAFRQFLPGMRQISAVGDLTRLYVGQRFDIVIRPVLVAEEVPMTRLGGTEHAPDGSPAGSRLGWTTWLESRPSKRNRSDAAFSVN